MKEVAASRRAGSKFGDLAFSVIAAGLGLVLLFATGRHLFGAPSVDQPERTLASITANAVPAPSLATAAGAQAIGSPILRVSNVGPALPIRARAVSLPRGFLRPDAPPATSLKPAARLATSLKPAARLATLLKPAARLATLLKPVAPPATLLKPAAPPRTSIMSPTAERAASLPASRGSAGASHGPRPAVGVRNAVLSKAKPRAMIPRTSPVGDFRPSNIPAFVVPPGTGRSHSPLTRAAIYARPSSVAAPLQISARRVRAAERARIVLRSLSARAPSIIEPPLGYDVRPVLVVAPGSAQLELGEFVIPTIRSKRRH